MQRVLRQYATGLEVRWDDRRHAWYLWYDGKKQPSALHHNDGTLVRDLSVGEIEQLVREADGHQHWDSRIRRLEQSTRDRAERRQAHKQNVLEDFRREAPKALRRQRMGPRPFVRMPAMSRTKEKAR